jgi:hypothetical protein
MTDPAPAKVTAGILGVKPGSTLEVVVFPPVGNTASSGWAAYVSAAIDGVAPHPPSSAVDPVSITNTTPVS